MRDEQLRRLQRQQRRAADLPLATRLLLEKVRRGALSADTLGLLAAAGDPTARAALGQPAAGDLPLRAWVWGLLPWGRPWVVRALIAAARHVLSPVPPRAAALLQAAEAWCACPCSEHADAAYRWSRTPEPDAGGGGLAYHAVLAAHVAGHMHGEPGERSLSSMVGIAVRTARLAVDDAAALRDAMRDAILAQAWAEGAAG